MGTLHQDIHTFVIISHRIIIKMRNVSDKSYRESQKTRFVFNNLFLKILPFMR